MKIGEFIQRIQSGIHNGVQSDDARIANRHVYNAMMTNRQFLVSAQARKNQHISDWNYVVLPCVELIEVPSHECPCLPEIGCKVWRTKYPLPKPLNSMDRHLIKWVMSIESSIEYSETSREEYSSNKGNKYTSKMTKYIPEKGHLYFYGKHIPRVVKVKMLPEDPTEALNYASMCPDCEECDGCKSYLDMEFPIDSSLAKPMIDLCIEEFIERLKESKEDQTNNSADSRPEESR